MALLRGRQAAPGAPPPPAESGLSIANVLRTGVQLNGNGPTALIPHMYLFSRCNFKFKVEIFTEISS
jgi:hypothetical protein